jgi:hypothetical protein
MEKEPSLSCVATRSHHWFISSRMNPVHSLIFHLLEIHFYIRFSSSLRSSKWSLSFRFSGQNLSLLSSVCATCLTHLILLDFVILIILDEELSLCNCRSCCLGPCSQTHSVYVLPFNMRHQVSHPYKTIDKITLLCVLILPFLQRRREDWSQYAEKKS